MCPRQPDRCGCALDYSAPTNPKATRGEQEMPALIRFVIGPATLLCATLCFAQNAPIGTEPYPTRPVRIVVPFAAGGPGDLISRLIAQKLSEGLGKQFYVENQGG